MGKLAIFSIVCVAASLIFGPRPAPLKKGPAARKARFIELYGKLPLSFEANQGQADRTVKFLSRGPGYTLFLTPTEAVLELRTADFGLRNDKNPQPSDTPHSAPRTPHSAVVRMRLVGANPNPKVTALDEFPARTTTSSATTL